jgi:hypothetical protein
LLVFVICDFCLDIKLLEQYYCAWKNGSLVEYHLNCSAVDKAVQGRLDQLIQTSLKRAVEDGSILQVTIIVAYHKRLFTLLIF